MNNIDDPKIPEAENNDERSETVSKSEVSVPDPPVDEDGTIWNSKDE